MKAFTVQEPHESSGGIIFANHAIEARREGANLWNDGELHGMTVRRAPEIDGMQGDKRAINTALLNRGWLFGEDEISLETHPNAFVAKNGEVYANPMDWLGEREHIIRYRQRSGSNRGGDAHN